MFRALGRFFRSIGALLTGKVDKQADKLASNPDAMKGEYTRIITEKKQRLQTAMDAVSQIMALRNQNKNRLARVSTDKNKQERLMTGALAMAKRRATALQAQGKSPEEIKTDEEVVKCQAAYRDFKSTVERLSSEIANLEQQDVQYNETTTKHKAQLEQIQRELSDLDREQHEAVADVISASERRRAADVLSKISTDGTGESLERLRNIREKTAAKAQISEELAGTDTAAQEAAFLDFAEKSQADDEFTDLLGLEEAPATEAQAAAGPEVDTRLPE